MIRPWWLVVCALLGVAGSCGSGMFCVSVALGFVAAARGLENIAEDPLANFLSLFISLGSDVFGGVAAAALARGAEARAAGLGGAVMLAISVILFIPFQMSRYPLWYLIPSYLFVVPAFVLGAVIVRSIRVLLADRAARNTAHRGNP